MRRGDRIRRVNTKRPAAPPVELYPLAANDSTGTIIDYLVELLDEHEARRKG